ncbi:MAG: hypothetical protein ABIQ77_01140 [Anaerolineales bacterium]
MKKIFVSAITTLLLMIILASTTFAAPTTSERELLLKGSLKTTETQQAVFPTLFVSATGSGNATQLGLFTISSQAQVNIPTLASSTSSTLVAADGSTLVGVGTGQGTPTATPGIVSIVETYTITGGTDRFEGATGTFTVVRVLNRATGISSGTISGTIVLP